MLERLGGVLRAPHVARLVAASLVARLPYAMTSLAMVLLMHDRTGGFAAGGALSGAFAVSAGLAQPAQGRLVDRVGQTRVLIGTAALHAAALLSLVALAVAGASLAVLLPLAVVGGLGAPPVGACLRALWDELLAGDEERVRVALTIDAIVLDVVFVGGPLLAAALIALASPALTLVVATALAAGGALAFAATPPSLAWRRGQATVGGLLGPLTAPGLRTLLVAGLALGVCFGAMEVAFPAFGVEHGAPSVSGVVFAALSLGSVAGGLIYAARAPARLRATYLLLLAAMPVGMVLLALPGSIAAMLVLAPLAGSFIAPLTAAESELAGALAPPGAITESYAWVITSTVIGLAVGTTAGGVIADAAGWQATLLSAAGVGAAGALLTAARRGTLVAT